MGRDSLREIVVDRSAAKNVECTSISEEWLTLLDGDSETLRDGCRAHPPPEAAPLRLLHVFAANRLTAGSLSLLLTTNIPEGHSPAVAPIKKQKQLT